MGSLQRAACARLSPRAPRPPPPPPPPAPTAVVAMSRSRLGLYIFGRAALFSNCFELQPTFSQLLAQPLQLQLVPGEHYGACERPADADPPTSQPVAGLEQMAGIVQHMAQQWEAAAAAWARQQQVQQDAAAAAAGAVEQAMAVTAPPQEEQQQGEEGEGGEEADEAGEGGDEAGEGCSGDDEGDAMDH